MKNLLTIVIATILCVIFSFSAFNTINTIFTAQHDVFRQQWSWERYQKNYWHIKLLQLADELQRKSVPDVDTELPLKALPDKPLLKIEPEEIPLDDENDDEVPQRNDGFRRTWEC